MAVITFFRMSAHVPTMVFVSHPFIVPDKVEERRYQVNMANGGIASNSLLILPTGLGKTIVALFIAVEFISKGKILIMAPSKPLLDQHVDTFRDLMVGHSICEISGDIAPKKRAEMVEKNDVIIATPQTVSNDLKNGMYSLDNFSLVIYDEAHRGVGDYSYVTVAQHCHKGIRSIGMTASPGSNINKIKEVCVNLNLKRIDARFEDDPDVAPYVHDTYVIKLMLNLPDDLVAIDHFLREQLDRYVKELVSLKLMNPARPPTRGHLLEIQNMLQMRVSSGEKTVITFKGLALTSKSIKISHAIMLAETQGITPLKIYLNKLEEEAEQEKGGRSAKELISREEYINMRKIVDSTNVEHPKVSKTMSIVSKILIDDPESKVIVFTQYRDTCDMMVKKLSAINGAKVSRLIGQAKDGMKQKEQEAMLDRLRMGEINVIVATSVGEEGLDISSTNAVIFYEPVPSGIRTIQRMGRTGRKNDGDVYVMIAKGTMDEAAEATSKKKMETMKASIDKLNMELKMGKPIVPDTRQRNLDVFWPDYE
jgi:Fanconi anemia group M protein